MQKQGPENSLNLPIFSLFDEKEKFNQEVKAAIDVLETNKRVSKKKGIIKRWTSEQILKYFIFVDYHTQKFMSYSSQRLPSQIFKLMSQFIKTKNCDQCRSHHQKVAKTGVPLQTKLDLFKANQTDFQELAQQNAQLLKTQEDQSFYLKCYSDYTENYQKKSEENSEEKLSPATTTVPQKTSEEKSGSQDLCEKMKEIIHFYGKWKNMMEELMKQSEQDNGEKPKEETQKL